MKRGSWQLPLCIRQAAHDAGTDILFDPVLISSGKELIATQAKKIGLSHTRLITVEKPVYQADKTAEVLVTE